MPAQDPTTPATTEQAPSKPRQSPRIVEQYQQSSITIPASTAGPKDDSLRFNAKAVVTCHETNWYDPNDAKGSHIKKVVFRQWSINDQHGEKILPGKRGQKLPSRLDVWLMTESPAQLDLEVVLTSANLEKKGKPSVTKGELVAWKGVTILFTRVHC